MKTVSAKRLLMVVVALFSVSLIIGCAGMEKRPAHRGGYLYYPTELVAADRALDSARLAGKDKQCPSEFNAQKEAVDNAYAIYMACHTKEAIAMAQEATAKINALCPARPRAAVAPAPPVAAKAITYEDIYFKFDQSTLSPEAQTILRRNVQVLNANPNTKVRIAGYASSSGTAEYNQRLSERRANAVRDFLINEGIARDRVSIIGYGETRPAMQEDNPADLRSDEAKANMRVRFEIIE
jgi:outer membrane protein OmpA-like peptidoglycan-associated protein